MEAILQKIHEQSLYILANIGFKVIDERILRALEIAGFRIKGNTVFFSENQVMAAIESTPQHFELKAINPAKNIIIGQGAAKTTGGYGSTFVVGADGIRHNALFDDYINFVKLIHHSDIIDLNGGILVQPADLDNDTCYPLMLYASLVLSDLPILGFSMYENNIRQCMELAAIAFGGHDRFINNYHILTLVNSQTPLQFGDIGEQTLLLAAEYNQPLIISPGTTCGMASPISPAASLTIGNAEALAFITIAQTLRKGLPVIYGVMATYMNMRTGGVSTSHPLVEQICKMARALAQKYKLPYRSPGSFTNALKPGIQSSLESQYGLVNSLNDKASILIHAAGCLDNFISMSYEKFMMDCEAIRTINKSLEPLDLADDHLDMQEIEQVGIGGNYLLANSTLKYCRQMHWESPFNPQAKTQGTDLTNDDGEYLEKARLLAKKWLIEYQQPHFDPKLKQALQDYLLKIGVSPAQLNKI